MDLFDVARSCFRRWYVVLPLLLVAGWFSHHVYTSTKPVYYSQAVFGVTPPSTRLDQTELGVPVPRNGLLDLGGASLITNLAVIGMRDPSVVAQVVAAGGEANYTARMFPVPGTMPELPLVMVEATEPDPVAASKTVELVLAQANPTLDGLQKQANVPVDQMVRSFVVSPPSAPVAGVPSRTKSTISSFRRGCRDSRPGRRGPRRVIDAAESTRAEASARGSRHRCGSESGSPATRRQRADRY